MAKVATRRGGAQFPKENFRIDLESTSCVCPAEHRLARLMQLGVRQARYFGRMKTLFQLLMAATITNLTLVAMRTGLMRNRNHPKTIISMHILDLLAILIAICSLFAAPPLDPGLRNHTRSLCFRPRF